MTLMGAGVHQISLQSPIWLMTGSVTRGVVRHIYPMYTGFALDKPKDLSSARVIGAWASFNLTWRGDPSLRSEDEKLQLQSFADGITPDNSGLKSGYVHSDFFVFVQIKLLVFGFAIQVGQG